jgi:hypothetical protein
VVSRSANKFIFAEGGKGFMEPAATPVSSAELLYPCKMLMEAVSMDRFYFSLRQQ